MRRRQYLAAAAASVGIAGCSGLDVTAGSTATPDPTPTPEPTPTPTPEPEAPSVITASPVYRWQEFGDVDTNTIDSVGQGAYLYVAARYEIWNHNGTVDLTDQVRVYDSSGTRVAIEQEEGEQLSEGNGLQEWEGFVAIDTSRLEQGAYTGDYVVRDNLLGESSEPVDWEADVVAPLDGDEAALTAASPQSVAVGERYTSELTIENRTDRDSSVVSTISARRNQSRWYELREFEMTIPAGEARTRQLGEGGSFDEAGRYEIRIDALDDSWVIDVQ